MLENERAESPCRDLLSLGLNVHQLPSGTQRWVTAAGWGNPDADLYLLGTTPKWHSPQIEGPNYAPTNVDRGTYARDFALSLFPEFIGRPHAPLRRTTVWTLALVRAWHGRDIDLLRDVFVCEMVLCPQNADPSPAKFRKAYEQCLKKHLFPLAVGGEARERRIVVILGAGGTKTLYKAVGAGDPPPSATQPVVIRPADALLPFGVIASLAPQAAMRNGLSCSEWTAAVLDARAELSERARQVTPRPLPVILKRIEGDIPRVSGDASDLPFFPESLLHLRKRWGRRWAVTQAFAYGGTVLSILQRAAEFDARRCRELGVEPSVGIEQEYRHFNEATDDYPARLLAAGWTVLRWNDRWVVEPPS
ncbi:MAG: hypothetical protein C0506_13700 [Anaerolinea sp.]|nr:hypothetical protein [Anaerolinea sp.]